MTSNGATFSLRSNYILPDGQLSSWVRHFPSMQYRSPRLPSIDSMRFFHSRNGTNRSSSSFSSIMRSVIVELAWHNVSIKVNKIALQCCDFLSSHCFHCLQLLNKSFLCCLRLITLLGQRFFSNAITNLSWTNISYWRNLEKKIHPWWKYRGAPYEDQTRVFCLALPIAQCCAFLFLSA